jgi:hypothetical protein
MPTLSHTAVPSYRFHKQSGQAIVTLSGKDVLLGKYYTVASRAEYNRRIAEWVANGSQHWISDGDNRRYYTSSSVAQFGETFGCE